MVERTLNWFRRSVAQYPARAVAIVVWIGAIAAARLYMSANDIGVGELLEDLQSLLADNWYGPLLYIAVYLIRPLTLFPASWYTVLAGNVFGLPAGFAIALVSGTVSSLVPYTMGRWFAPERSVETVRDELTRLQRFVDLMQRNPFQTVLTMRLLFLPYDGVSLLAGGLRLPLLPFLTATAIGNVPGTFFYVGLGASIDGDLTSGELTLNPWVLAASVGVLVVSLLLSRLIRARGDMDHIRNETNSDNKQTGESLNA